MLFTQAPFQLLECVILAFCGRGALVRVSPLPGTPALASTDPLLRSRLQSSFLQKVGLPEPPFSSSALLAALHLFMTLTTPGLGVFPPDDKLVEAGPCRAPSRPGVSTGRVCSGPSVLVDGACGSLGPKKRDAEDQRRVPVLKTEMPRYTGALQAYLRNATFSHGMLSEERVAHAYLEPESSGNLCVAVGVRIGTQSSVFDP